MIIPRFSFFQPIRVIDCVCFPFIFRSSIEAAENISLKLEIGRALTKG